MGINYDISMFVAVDDAIRAFTGQDHPGQEPESISGNVSDLLDELLDMDIDFITTNTPEQVQQVIFERGISTYP